MRRRERQDKVYSACIASECTFKPDTRVSKYYYQRLESRDPAYQRNDHHLRTLDNPPTTAGMGAVEYHPLRAPGVGSGHYRNLSEGLSEKERL